MIIELSIASMMFITIPAIYYYIQNSNKQIYYELVDLEWYDNEDDDI